MSSRSVSTSHNVLRALAAGLAAAALGLSLYANVAWRDITDQITRVKQHRSYVPNPTVLHITAGWSGAAFALTAIV